MVAAPARPMTEAPARRHRGVAPVALRVAGSGESPVPPLDLDAAWADAVAPHHLAARRDADLAEVIDLDARRRGAVVSPRVRRNRLTALLFVIGLAVVLAVGAGGLVAAADGPTAIGDTVTVQPGQTLWDVAVATTADGDPRVTLDRIRELNGLTGTDVPAWTAVVLPASLD